LFDLVVLTLSILCLTQFFKNEKRLSNDKDKWYRDSIEDHFGLIGFLIFGIVFGAVFIVGLGFNIDNIITGFVNPEYGAIKTIMYFVK